MPGTLAGLLAGLQLFVSLFFPAAVIGRLQTGEWLRFHVIAPDDTAEMQRLKLIVRDAVQDAYRQRRTPGSASMQEEAVRLLPELTAAAREAARNAGYPGAVAISLTEQVFSERQLGRLRIPAGTYPALVIRLGDARGQNWWGLLDPELSLAFAGIPETDDGDVIQWDWSLRTLLYALLGRPLPPMEGA